MGPVACPRDGQRGQAGCSVKPSFIFLSRTSVNVHDWLIFGLSGFYLTLPMPVSDLREIISIIQKAL